MVRNFSFTGKLEVSKGLRAATDMDTIKSMIPSCVDVRMASVEADRKGVDYVATLRGGRELAIDAKTREEGCSCRWRYGEPELALERWSVAPKGQHKGKYGWTLDVSKQTDMVLYIWSPVDTDHCYLLPFQHLRSAFIQFGKRWLEKYGNPNSDDGLFYQQTEDRYRSACIFVPASDVLEGIRGVSMARAVMAMTP